MEEICDVWRGRLGGGRLISNFVCGEGADHRTIEAILCGVNSYLIRSEAYVTVVL